MPNTLLHLLPDSMAPNPHHPFRPLPPAPLQLAPPPPAGPVRSRSTSVTSACPVQSPRSTATSSSAETCCRASGRWVLPHLSTLFLSHLPQLATAHPQGGQCPCQPPSHCHPYLHKFPHTHLTSFHTPNRTAGLQPGEVTTPSRSWQYRSSPPVHSLTLFHTPVPHTAGLQCHPDHGGTGARLLRLIRVSCHQLLRGRRGDSTK